MFVVMNMKKMHMYEESIIIQFFLLLANMCKVPLKNQFTYLNANKSPDNHEFKGFRTF